MKKLPVILLIFIMVFSISACGKTIKTEDGKISMEDGKVEIQTEDGSTTIEEGKITFEDEDGSAVFEASEDGVDLPDGFPEDLVPIIKNSIVLMASAESAVDDKEFYLTVATKTEVTDTVDFYEEVMKNAEAKSTMSVEGMDMISGSKEGVYITINIIPSEEEDYKATIIISTASEG